MLTAFLIRQIISDHSFFGLWIKRHPSFHSTMAIQPLAVLVGAIFLGACVLDLMALAWLIQQFR